MRQGGNFWIRVKKKSKTSESSAPHDYTIITPPMAGDERGDDCGQETSPGPRAGNHFARYVSVCLGIQIQP
jgi:hypothetical protein